MPSNVLPRAAPTSLVVALTLTLLLGLQPITTDLYLPTLPGIQHDLGASVGSTQLTLSVLIVCFGVGQLICGPLSDRHGRRPVLLAGMALYTAASLGSASAQSIQTLIGWRAVQGAALAAAVTCGRSILRDVFMPHEGARVMSRVLGGLGLVAMLSPVAGGLLAQWWGWHAALAASAVYGAATWAYVAWSFDETLSRPNPHATRPGHIWRNWREVGSNPTFRAWTALLCATYGGLFVMLAGSSFVYINMLGTSRATYGLILAANSLTYIAGTLLCRRLLRRHGLRGAVKRGAAFSLAGGVGMSVLSLLGLHSVWAIMLPQSLFALGHGIHQPCGQTGAVGPFPDKAGAAASLSGFAMMATAFCIGQWLGHTLDRSVYPVTLGVGAASVALAGVAWTLVQRDGDPHAIGATELRESVPAP